MRNQMQALAWSLDSMIMFSYQYALLLIKQLFDQTLRHQKAYEEAPEFK